MIEWFAQQLKEAEDVLTSNVYFLSVSESLDKTPILNACATINIFDLAEVYDFIGMSGNYPILQIKEPF